MSDAMYSGDASELTTDERRVTAGQKWTCDESKAADLPEPWDRPHGAVGIADHAHFRAVVINVTNGVAELSVTVGNGHPRTPDQGATIDLSVDTLRDDPRWRLLTNRGDGGE